MHASIPLVAVVVRPEAAPVLESLRPLARRRVQVAEDPVPAQDETRRRRAWVGLQRSPSRRIRERRAAPDSGDVPVGGRWTRPSPPERPGPGAMTCLVT